MRTFGVLVVLLVLVGCARTSAVDPEYFALLEKQMHYYKDLGDRTLEQLDEEDLFWSFNAESNTIAVLIHHISGNMKSRWTEVLTTDGEKEWRDRDHEFDEVVVSKEQLLIDWEVGWQTLFDAMDALDEEDWGARVRVRNRESSLIESLNKELAHYAYHVGQIVFIGKMRKGAEWESLTIEKGKSAEFNQQEFGEAAVK